MLNDFLKDQVKKGAYLFQCTAPGCDNNLYPISQSELEEAEGQINCDVCGGKCDIIDDYALEIQARHAEAEEADRWHAAPVLNQAGSYPMHNGRMILPGPWANTVK